VFKNVEEFLKLGPKKEKAFGKPVCCKPSALFGDIVGEIVSTATHRIYVVDDMGNPIGVISLGDILEAIKHSVK
jgi:CBS domain-containing protein